MENIIAVSMTNTHINKHTFIEKNNDPKFSKNNLTGLLSDSTPALCSIQKSFENAFLISEFELRFQTDFRTTIQIWMQGSIDFLNLLISSFFIDFMDQNLRT